ncbi:hypothetical protein Plec18167_002209 [Paecilomyces lecythidis]|uniref:Allergen Asp f 4 n=1 Tax=Paecilomyces lecythidis TaxID=3004212 RepID=A0ABR3Y8I7_9EURO
MQLKNSLLLLTAVSAGSAMGRLHGHERRHAQLHEKRDVGDWVYAEIDGVWQSWKNNWSGSPTTAAAAVSSAAPTAAASTTAEATPVVTSSPSASASSSSSSSSSNTEWHSTPADGVFSWEGFGQRTTQSGNGVEYKGNVGSPYGSNIQEISEADAPNYKYVVRFVGDNTDPWTVGIWNKIGPDGQMTGWYGNAVKQFTLQPGEVKFVAFDEDSQGGWGAAQGNELPKDQYGGYACTWGEFDFGSSANNGFSGWDVSAIQAEAANLTVQGMQICEATGTGCSAIADALSEVIAAYTYALKEVNGLGGNKPAGPVRLNTILNWSKN